MKKTIKILLVFFGLLIPFACEDMALLVDCDDCFTEKPTDAVLTIKVTINDENVFVPITIYFGNIEDGTIIKEDITYFDNYKLVVDVDEYYSVLVKYNSKARTIYAVDGKKLRVKKDNSSCDNICYLVLGNVLDARLK
ncbi:MAG: hypothetical protein AB9846_13145 [Tenuifilaceae bacterium]